jgi:hypothetical protein
MTELHFLGPDGALSRFPDRDELQRLGSLAIPAHLSTFIDQAWQATTRIWVLDLHFVEHGYQGLVRALTGALVHDVRIVSERVQEKGARLDELRKASDAAWNRGRPRGTPRIAPTRLQWFDRLVRRPAAFPFAHDRFAIVDENLWHFGYASCGSGNCLSAASGPWPESNTNAIEFFERLWEGMGS